MLGAKRRALELMATAQTVLLGVGLASLACKSDPVQAPPSASTSPALDRVAEPSNLLATVVIQDADAVLGRARELLLDRGGFLFSRDRVGTLGVELGLPASTIDLFSPKEPVVCAFLSAPSPSRSVPFACAARVHDVRELMTLTTGGASPKLRARHDEATLADVLTPIAGPPLPLALGVFRDHLVAASDESALLALGPFLDRNLALSAPLDAATPDVDLHVRGPAIASIVERLAGSKLALLPAQANAVIDPDALLKALRSSDDIDVGVTIASNRLDLSASTKLPPNAGSYGLSQGPLSDALGAPAGAQAALTMFEDRDARVAAVTSATAPFSTLIEKDDARLLDDALTGLAAGRGDRTTFGFELGARGPALFGDLSIADSEGVDRSLVKLTEALDAKSIKGAFGTAGFGFSSKRTVLERVGDVTRFRVVRSRESQSRGSPSSPASTDDGPPPIDLFLRVDGARIALATGYDAAAALGRVLGGEKLSDEPRARDALSRAPKTVSLALFVDPLAIEKPRDHVSSSALATLLVDPKEQVMSATLELDSAALGGLLDLVLTQ